MDTQSDQPDMKRLYETAWSAARGIVNDHGEIDGEIDAEIARFMRRKACQNVPDTLAESTYRIATEIACETQRFRRKNIGPSIPVTDRRHELLLSLSEHLKTRCPDAPDYFIGKACNLVEMMWAR